jgi:general secretion pathway protein E
MNLTPIGELLIQKQLVSGADVERALQLQPQLGARLGQILIRIGAISEDNLLPVLAGQLGIPVLDEALLPTSAAVIEQAAQLGGISTGWLAEQGVVIWEGVEGAIECASVNPLNSFVNETLSSSFTQHRLHWHFIRSRDVERMLNLLRADGLASAFSDEVAHLRELAEEAPVIELVNNTWAQAIDLGASDIHIEPEEHGFEIRFRVDGILTTKMRFGRDRFDAVVSRIKLISGLDIAERRLPQDGRISIRASGIDIDIRVSVIPGVHGESIVLRLLPKERKDFSLKNSAWKPIIWKNSGNGSRSRTASCWSPGRPAPEKAPAYTLRWRSERPRKENHHGRRSGGIQDGWHHPDPDPCRNRIHLCPRTQGDSAA